MNRSTPAALLLSLLLTAACGGAGDGAAASEGDKPEIAYVTNGVATFWTIAAAGCRDAAQEFDAECDVRMPTGGIVDQKRAVEDLLTRGIDEACALTHVITHDSDAPASDRLCYVGMDNYAAGRECGKLVKEALPDGGSVVIFVGRLEQDNAKHRRQGVIDELLGRPADRENYDPPGQPLEGGGYTILDTRTDQFDYSRAKSNAEDALALYPDLGCMVGLFAYNPPLCLEALEESGRLGQVKLVAFDEDDRTLQGILDGQIHGTVVQQPYRYGYESVRILAALARGDRSVLPEGGFLDVPARVIRRPEAREFWDELRALVGEPR
jgi:ribose transport system substrate-binding protein